MKFLLFFLLFPLIELYLFIEVGDQIGGMSTVLLTLLTALIGISTARSQGMATAHKLQELLRMRTGGGALAGQVSIEILSAVMIFAAGVLLFIPGFFTDTIGFLLLLPQLRQQLAAKTISRQRHRAGQHQQSGSDFYSTTGQHADNARERGFVTTSSDVTPDDDGNDIIDGEYTRLDRPRVSEQSDRSAKDPKDDESR